MDNPDLPRSLTKAEEAERLYQLLAAIVRAWDSKGDIEPLIQKAREETRRPEPEPTAQPTAIGA